MSSNKLAVSTDPIRVLVVDDSAFHRRQIIRSLEKCGKIRVVAEAPNGREAVRLNREIHPDVVTMDVVMPVMGGIEAVREIMATHPTKIVVFTAYSDQNANAALDAMQAGAVDFVAKDVDRLFDERISGAEQLRQSVLNLAVRHSVSTPSSVEGPAVLNSVTESKMPSVVRRPELVVVGASTGGPLAIQESLSALPADFRLPILVVVHMPAGFSEVFAKRMDQLSQLDVKEARDGDPLLPGTLLIAPGGKQTLIEGRRGSARVAVKTLSGQLYKPCVDLAFSSAAEVLGSRVLAITMTGMGADGSVGARDLKSVGAQVWTQTEESCVVYGMPKAVDQAGLSDRRIALSRIGAALTELG